MPAMLEIDIADDEEIVIVGDIHGQLFDLMNIIDLIGESAKRCKYIFNGDFVDQGTFGDIVRQNILSLQILGILKR